MMEGFETDEDILKFAIDREVKANRFYLALARHTADPEMRAVFEMLAQDELEHKAKLELEVMKTGKVLAPQKDVNKFEDHHEDLEPVLNMDFKDALAIGIDKEKASFRLYADWMVSAENEEQREMLLSLAQEEAKHKARLEMEYDMLIKNL